MVNWEIVTEQAGENKGYVYLSVACSWEIERLQSALNTVFGWDQQWRWNDPYTYHITLAYSENITDEQLLRAGNAIVGKSALDLKITAISAFENPNNQEKAVYLKVEDNEALSELQKAVYDALNVEGVVLSEFSNPEVWNPHITLAYAPMDSVVPEVTSMVYVYSSKVCIGRSDYEILADFPLKWSMKPRYGEDGTGPLREQVIWKVEVPEVPDPVVEEVATEMGNKKEPIRLTFISEMRGNPPKIDLPKDIDLDELRREYRKVFGDEELEFWTLPIGQVDAKSRNERTYPRTPVEELVQQVNELRPEGMWGHLSDEEFSTRYDPPAIRWLAAIIDKDGIAWGKHLPLTVETRDYYRLARATRAQVATSLTALAEMDGRVVQHLELNTIDIADPRRVGITATVAMPQMTKEMNDSGENVVSVGQNHDVIVRVRELQSINEEITMEDTKVIEELTGERDLLKGRVTEFESKLNEANAKITELETREKTHLINIGELLQEYIVAEVKEQVSIEGMRDLITDQVIMLQPQTRDAVKEAVLKVLDKESVKKALKVSVVEQMGPPQPAQPKQNENQTPEEKYLMAEPKVLIPQREA